MKDLKFIFLFRLHGQVYISFSVAWTSLYFFFGCMDNVVDEAFVLEDELNFKKEAKDFADFGNNIEACTIELQSNKKLRAIKEPNYFTLIVTNVLAICSIEFNLIESAIPYHHCGTWILEPLTM